MTEIPADFDAEEMDEIAKLAEKMGMTVQEFVEYASKKYVNDVKEEARAKILTPPKLRIYK